MQLYAVTLYSNDHNKCCNKLSTLPPGTITYGRSLIELLLGPTWDADARQTLFASPKQETILRVPIKPIFLYFRSGLLTYAEGGAEEIKSLYTYQEQWIQPKQRYPNSTELIKENNNNVYIPY